MTLDTIPFRALAETIAHYDAMREHHGEHDARWLSIRYLMRKHPATMSDFDAAAILADALARRATCRIVEARAEVVQGSRASLDGYECDCRGRQ